MPKVTAEYRAARHQQILHAAWTCFARNGFHATTMADIIAESGLSAGAVYGYFRSKEQLIGEAARTTIGVAAEPIAADLTAMDPPDLGRAVTLVVGRLFETLLADGFDKSLVAVQGFAETSRNPQLMALVRDTHTQIRGQLTDVARRAQAAGLLASDADPAQVGAALLGLIQGLLIQRMVLGVSIEDYTAGVESLLSTGPAGSATRAARD